MVNILFSNYCGLWNDELRRHSNPPLFEGFCRAALDAGHNMLHIASNDFLQQPWAGSHNKINYNVDSDILVESVKLFNPDVIITANHSIPDIVLEITQCPIVVWDADAYIYFNDISGIKKNLDRYYFACFSKGQMQNIEKYFSVNSSRVAHVPPATFVVRQDLEKKWDVSFIGSFFGTGDISFFSDGSQNFYKKMIKDFYSFTKSGQEHHLNYLQEQCPDNYRELLGYLTAKDRLELIEEIASICDTAIFGPNDWLNCFNNFHVFAALSHKKTKIINTVQNQDVYNSSFLSLNVTHKQNVDGYPFRVPDILASSSVLITDKASFLRTEPFASLDLPYFESTAECSDLIPKLLSDPSWRHDIVARSNEAAEKYFRFPNRIEILLDLVGLSAHETSDKGKFYRVPALPNSMSFKLRRKLKRLKIENLLDSQFC